MLRGWMILAAGVVLLATAGLTPGEGVSTEQGEETPGEVTEKPVQAPEKPEEEMVLPEWAETGFMAMTGAGLVVLLGGLGVWAARGRVLEQKREIFRPWGALEAVVLMLTWVLFKSWPMQLAMWLRGGATADIPTGIRLGGDVMAAGVVIWLAAWMMRKRFGLGLESMGLRRDRVLAAIGLAVLARLAVMPAQEGIGIIFRWLGVEVKQEVVEQAKHMLGLDFGLLCVLAVVVAPIIEEFLFRGVIQMALRKHIGAWGAILLGGALFAAIHGDWTISPLKMQAWSVPMALLPLGVVLGYLYQKRQSLMAPIFLHALFNGINMAMLGMRHSA